MSVFAAKIAVLVSPPRATPARIEERYALAMQSINYAVYDADLEGGEVYFSEQLAQHARDEAGRSGAHHRQYHRENPSRRPSRLPRGDRCAFQGRHAAIRGRFPFQVGGWKLALVPPVLASRCAIPTDAPIASSAR